MNILSPSILAADFTKLGEQIQMAEEGGAKYLHIDVMDGMFVPAISLGMCVIESIRKATNITFDVHLMVTEPARYITEFAGLGADIITIHYEACENVEETLKAIRKSGCRVGISIKPATDVKVLIPYLDMIDMVLIMTVEPGFGGQKYIEASTQRIKDVRQAIDQSGKEIDLEVDGGIRLDNIEMVLEAGANVIVTGSAVFHGDIKDNVTKFMHILEKNNKQ